MNVKGFLNDYTALHYAAYNGHTTCAQALLRAGARCTVVNKYDETPAQSAHSRGHSHIEKGIQRWLLSNPESKQTSGVSSALEGHTRKGQGLTKSICVPTYQYSGRFLLAYPQLRALVMQND